MELGLALAILGSAFDNPRKEIEILLQDVLECNRVDIYLRFEEPLGKNQLKILRDWVQRSVNNTARPPRSIYNAVNTGGIISKIAGSEISFVQ